MHHPHYFLYVSSKVRADDVQFLANRWTHDPDVPILVAQRGAFFPLPYGRKFQNSLHLPTSNRDRDNLQEKACILAFRMVLV